MWLTVITLQPKQIIWKDWDKDVWLSMNIPKNKLRKVKSAIQSLASRNKSKVKFTYDEFAEVLWAKNLGQ